MESLNLVLGRRGHTAGQGRRRRLLTLVAVFAVATPGASAAQVLPDATWEVVGEIQRPSFSGVSVPLSGGRALLTGSGETNREVLLYDPAHGLVRVADAPAQLSMHIAAPLDDGRRVLVCGGASPDFLVLTNRCFVYDPSLGDWSEVASLPSPAFFLYSNPAATLPDGRVIVTGGSTPDDLYGTDFAAGFGVFGLYAASRTTLLFDPLGRTVLPNGTVVPGAWSTVAPMPITRVFATHAPAFTGRAIALDRPRACGRVGHALVVLADGRVLVAGGRAYNPGFYYGTEHLDIYNPRVDKWTRLQGLPAIPDDGDGGHGGRGFPGVTLLESGDVLISGGTPTRLVETASRTGRVTFRLAGPASPRRSTVLLDPTAGDVRRVGDLNVGRLFSLAPAGPAGGAIAIGGWSVTPYEPVPAEAYDPVPESWSLLPVEQPPAVDGGPRLGTGLTDGTVLTWSVDESNPSPATVKRFHPGS